MQFRNPAADVVETDNEIIVTLDMPGIDKKDIELVVRNDIIEVRAQKKHEIEVKNKGIYRHERSYTGYYRVLPCQ